jgi:hypothetical protein
MGSRNQAVAGSLPETDVWHRSERRGSATVVATADGMVLQGAAYQAAWPFPRAHLHHSVDRHLKVRAEKQP